MVQFFYNGWNDEEHAPCDDSDDGKECDDDAQYPRLYLASVLNEAHYGVQQVCDEPCYQEWHEHVAEASEKVISERGQRNAGQGSYKTVECDCFLVH